MTRRRRWVVSVMTLLIAASAGQAWAFWTAAGVGQAAAGSGSLVAATLSTPSAATNSITVTWTQQASLAPSSSANSSITYSVERRLGSGSYAAVSSGACSGPKPYGVTSCVDAPGANGGYSYRVVAHFATWTATSSASDAVSFVIDAAAPTVLSIDRVGATTTNLASVSWTVSFSETVSGVNNADFALVASGLTGTSITSVSGSDATYTVTASSGSGSGTLGLDLLDDDTISDAGANRLGGIGSGNGNRTGQIYTIDKTAPTVSSINRVGATPTNLTSVSWTVTFSETVTGVGAGDFALAASGPASISITSVSGSGLTYTVTANTGTGSGTLGLDLVDDDTITDGVTNPLGGIGAIANGNFTGLAYTIDKTAPTVTSINRVGASPTNATSVSWTVTFSEAVTGVGSGDFALAATGLTAAAITAISGSGTTYTVTASTGTGTPTGTLGLNLVDDDSIVDVVSNTLGGTGTVNGNLTGQTYAIDRTPPTAPSLISVTSGVVWTGTCTGVTSGTRYINGTATSASAATAAMTATVVPESGLTLVFSATSGATNVTTASLAAASSPVTTTQNLSGLANGPITLAATATDAAGNATTGTSSAVLVKDTLAPAAPTANYDDPLIGSPRVSGASECSAGIIAVRVGRPQDTYPTTAGSNGNYSVGVSGSLLGLFSVQYSVTATDRAGNTGAATTT